MNAVLKMCRACNVEKPKIKFSGRPAKCCMCMYAKNKEFFTKYYIDNQARITAYEREVSYSLLNARQQTIKRTAAQRKALRMFNDPFILDSRVAWSPN